MSTPPTQRIPFVLTSKDPSFAGLLEHLCHESPLHLLTTAGPSITLETVRSNAPEFVLLDLDSVDAQEASRLILKLALVSHAFVLLTGINAVPGTPGLDAFYQAGAHGALVKPEGKTSLSLAGEAGTIYRQGLLDNVIQLRTRRLS
jgi:hypothetical protein